MNVELLVNDNVILLAHYAPTHCTSVVGDKNELTHV
jgi:hypothetical protein